FIRGNVKRDFTDYGAKIGVIYNAGPLPNVAEYDISIPRAGTYQLELRFAALESRPVELEINGDLVKSGAAAATTGGWYPAQQKWSVEGVFAFVAGKNRIRLKRQGPFPHFDKVALVPKDLPKGVSAPIPVTAERLASQHKLNPAFLRQWADHLK